MPLTLGLVDVFQRRGLRAFGASRAGAQIEGGKAFARALMAKHAIPTAAYREFFDPRAAIAYVRERGAPIVVKADGLAARKGDDGRPGLNSFRGGGDERIHASRGAGVDAVGGRA